MRRLALALPAVAALLVPAAAAPVPKGSKAALYFPTAKGASWTYTTGKSEYTEVVTGVEKKEGGAFVVAVGRDFKGTPRPLYSYEVSAKGLYRVMTGTTVMDPPRCLLKLPASAGDTWRHDPKPNQGLPARYTLKGEEEVEVPAGKFKALRVESELDARAGTTKTTYWYAPGVGRVKQVSKSGDVERVEELKSFTPAKE